MSPESHLFELIIGGIQLTLVGLAARIAYQFGALSQKLENIQAQLGEHGMLLRHLMEEGDELRERVAVVEARLNGKKT